MTTPDGKDKDRNVRDPLSPSEVRRDRKREIDRKSQRAVRQRTRAYIAKLEKQNEALLQLSQQARHSQALRTVRDQSNEVEERTGSRTVSNGKTHSSICSNSYVDMSSRAQIEDDATAQVPIMSELGQELVITPRSSQATSAKPDMPRIAMLLCSDGVRDYFSIANQALLLMEAVSRGLPCSDADEDEDIILQVSLNGWNAAASRHCLDAGWQLLRLLDEGLWFRSGPVERAAILRVMRAMSLDATREHVPQRQKPPTYMEPTAVQRETIHARLIDYFPWPLVRDYFIFTGTVFVPENLAAQFASDIGFRWSYELRDIALKDKNTGTYTFSREFNEAFNDPEAWFFKTQETAVYFPWAKDASNLNAAPSAGYVPTDQLYSTGFDHNDAALEDLLDRHLTHSRPLSTI